MEAKLIFVALLAIFALLYVAADTTVDAVLRQAEEVRGM